MHFIYNISIRILWLVIRISAFYNKKARMWIEGRKNLMDTVAHSIDQDSEHVWFHCASLGEFEQGRPVMEEFKKSNPHIKIVLTFFSPSGYENKKNYQGADHIFYLPLDTPQLASQFVEYVRPRAAVFVKYEFWYNFINALDERKIPLIFISVIFRKNQHFFKFYGKWFRAQLKKVTYFFVQNKPSQDLLYSIGVHNVVVSGDTRFDRVYQIRQSPRSFNMVEKFIQGSVIFMAGSTWPKDEEMLVSLINQKHKGLKYIVVPHEIDQGHIQKFCSALDTSVVKYSEPDENKFKDAQVLIIDSIGMLSNLYQYASIAYIGGGFGKGIHNILEPATFGMPLIFGPNYRKFAEACELVQYGGAFSVRNSSDLQKNVESVLSNYKLLSNISEITQKYVDLKKGATHKILLFLNTIVNPHGHTFDAITDINLN
jgi:3-deoxy-D-manno-octulosonic-acid transferase